MQNQIKDARRLLWLCLIFPFSLLTFPFPLCAQVPAEIAPFTAPILLNVDRAQRALQPLDQNVTNIPAFYIGDDVQFQVNLLSQGALLQTNQISQFTNVTVEIFQSQNDTNPPVMSNSVFTQTLWTNGETNFTFTNLTTAGMGPSGTNNFPTNAQFSLYWPGAYTALNLNGKSSQYFWLRCFATGTNGVVTTFGEGSVQVLNAPISALSPALTFGQGQVVVSNANGGLISPTNIFAANSNLLNQSVNAAFVTGASNYVQSPDGHVCVTNYGILGDSNTVNTAALQSLCNWAVSNGATLFFPGSYPNQQVYLTGPLTNLPSLEGPNPTGVEFPSGALSLLKAIPNIGGAWLTFNSNIYRNVRGMCFDGNRTNQSSPVDMIVIQPSNPGSLTRNPFTIEDCGFFGAASNGVLNLRQQVGLYRCEFQFNAGPAFVMTNLAQDCKLVDCDIGYNGQGILQLPGTGVLYVRWCNIYDNHGDGIFTGGNNSLFDISDGYINNNWGQGLVVSNGFSGLRMSKVHFNANNYQADGLGNQNPANNGTFGEFVLAGGTGYSSGFYASDCEFGTAIPGALSNSATGFWDKRTGSYTNGWGCFFYNCTFHGTFASNANWLPSTVTNNAVFFSDNGNQPVLYVPTLYASSNLGAVSVYGFSNFNGNLFPRATTGFWGFGTNNPYWNVQQSITNSLGDASLAAASPFGPAMYFNAGSNGHLSIGAFNGSVFHGVPFDYSLATSNTTLGYYGPVIVGDNQISATNTLWCEAELICTNANGNSLVWNPSTGLLYNNGTPLTNATAGTYNGPVLTNYINSQIGIAQFADNQFTIGTSNALATNLQGASQVLSNLAAHVSVDTSGDVTANAITTTSTVAVSLIGTAGLAVAGNLQAATVTSIGAASLNGGISLSGWNFPSSNSVINTNFVGYEWVSNGFASFASGVYSIASTGYTNAGRKTIKLWGFTGAGVTYKNLTSGNTFSLGTITVPSVLLFNPQDSVIGTGCAVSGATDF